MQKVKISKGYFVDDKGIKYDINKPILTAQVDFYGYPFCNETPADIGDLNRIQERLRDCEQKPNAWYDSGIVSEKTVKKEFKHMNLDGTIFVFEELCTVVTRGFEFYCLGE